MPFYGSLHMDVAVLWTQDVVWKTCWRMIGTDEEKESGKSVLSSRLDEEK